MPLVNELYRLKTTKTLIKYGHYDRGHQAPLASFTKTVYANRTNYLSNITPERSDVNRGAWLKLENGVIKLAKQYHTVYVVTGTLYDHKNDELAITLPKTLIAGELGQ